MIVTSGKYTLEKLLASLILTLSSKLSVSFTSYIDILEDIFKTDSSSETKGYISYT